MSNFTYCDNEKTDLERLSWREYFKQICETTAKRSCCSRLKVGCILVKDNRIISQGYNGYLPGFPHESIVKDNHEVATVHAEQNTIIDCAKRGVSCQDCEAYITHFPCLTCTKMLLAAGVKKIYYINDYKNDDTIYNFLIPETYHINCSKHATVEIIKI